MSITLDVIEHVEPLAKCLENCLDLAIRKGKAVGETKPTERESPSISEASYAVSPDER